MDSRFVEVFDSWKKRFMDSSYRRLTEWSIFEGAAEIQAHVIARRLLES